MGERIAITVTARKDPRCLSRTYLEVIGIIPPGPPLGKVSVMERIEDTILTEQRIFPDVEIMVITCSSDGKRLRIARPRPSQRVGWKAEHPPELD